VTGDESAAVAAADDAMRRGRRVLIVLRSGGPRVVPRLRRRRRAAKSQLTVMTNAEVACVDGVRSVEPVVVRYTRTGRLWAVNTSARLHSVCSRGKGTTTGDVMAGEYTLPHAPQSSRHGRTRWHHSAW
jgi:hypothetical protein